MRGDGYQMSGGMMSMMALGWIFLLALTVLVVVAIVWLIRSSRPSQMQGRPAMGQALAQLDLRYARGEIDRDEYVRRKGDLSESGSG